MAENNKDKLNSLEELKNKLSSKSYKTKIEHRDNFTSFHLKDVPQVWGETNGAAEEMSMRNKILMKTSIFKNFFLFAVAFLILTVGYAAYVFFAGGNTVSNNNIDISVVGNNFTAGGEELPFIVGITNRNNSPLELVDLVLEYPKGSADTTDNPGDVEHSRISLGTIPAGAVRNENVKLILFGEQGSIRNVKISIEYRVEGSNAIFVKEKDFNVTINSTPISLALDAPDTISPNQDVNLGVKVNLNSTRPASSVLLKVDYPVGFQFSKADPAPAFGNNIWSLGDLAPGAERDIAISGKMIDVVDGEEKVFHVSSGSQSASDKSTIDVLYNSLAHTITIKKPFIDAKISINGSTSRAYAVDTKTRLDGEIQWANNLDTNVNDLHIEAKLSGNGFDRKSITASQGFYDSSTDTITWSKASQNALAEISPGDSGSVAFSIMPLPLLSTGGLLSQPTIQIDVSVTGKQSAGGFSSEALNNFTSATVKLISDVGFVGKALYYSGPFVNRGSIPPKAEKQTTYSISWTVSNTANNISRAAIHATLPQWVDFLNNISPKDENLTYNPSTREIVWNIGNIPKGTSIVGPSKSVTFQVVLTPSLSQVGTSPILVNSAILTGHDDFANVDVRVDKQGLNTILGNDPSFPPGGGTVAD